MRIAEYSPKARINMNAAQEAAYERLLTSSLARISDVQKFAETKNAALLTFSSAWIVGSVNILFGSTSLPDFARNAISLSLPAFVLSASIAIVSFLPQLFAKQTGQGGETNLLFFMHLKDLSDPVNDFSVRYACAAKRTISDNLIKDLCNQICTNAEIAHRKFRLFNYSASALLLTLVAAVSSAIYGWATTPTCTAFLAYLGLH